MASIAVPLYANNKAQRRKKALMPIDEWVTYSKADLSLDREPTKDDAPLILPAAVSSGRRRLSDIEAYTGLYPFDLDNYLDIDRVLGLPYVYAAGVSFSGTSLYALIRSEAVKEAAMYSAIYKAIHETLADELPDWDETTSLGQHSPTRVRYIGAKPGAMGKGYYIPLNPDTVLGYYQTNTEKTVTPTDLTCCNLMIMVGIAFMNIPALSYNYKADAEDSSGGRNLIFAVQRAVLPNLSEQQIERLMPAIEIWTDKNMAKDKWFDSVDKVRDKLAEKESPNIGYKQPSIGTVFHKAYPYRQDSRTAVMDTDAFLEWEEQHNPLYCRLCATNPACRCV